MEPMALITSAISLATPFLIKTGEIFAENIGEGIWNLIKKSFLKNKEIDSNIDIKDKVEKEKLIHLLLEKIAKDNSFKEELEFAVKNGEKSLNAYYQQNINNNGQIEKQINIQNLTGNINF